MNPIDFIFKLFANHLQFEMDDATAVRNKLVEYWETSTGPVVKFFKSPIGSMALLVLPFLLPVLRKALDNFLDRLIGDRDGDGDIDPADALQKIVDSLRNNHAR